jgi:hypothetical protein
MIRKRNLDPALLQWIHSVTGIGPGIGEVHYLVDVDTAFYSWLRDDMRQDNALIHHDPEVAHAEMTTNRNDCLLVFPGDYTGTGADPLTWSKSKTHMLGLAFARTPHPTMQGVVIRTISTSGVYAMLNTGSDNIFSKINFTQWGQNAACVCAVKEQGNHNSFLDCGIVGMIRSQTSQDTDGCSLWINTAVSNAGQGNLYQDCVIGDSGGAERTVANGQILLGPTGIEGAGNNIHLLRCKINSRAADVDPCAILASANYCLDRQLLIEDCVFYNFVLNHTATKPAYVIRDGCNTTHDIILKNSVHHGFTAWTNNVTHCFNTAPDAADGGGESTAADAS